MSNWKNSMGRKRCLWLLLASTLIVSYSCNNNNNSPANTAKTAKASEPVIKILPVHLIDSIENLFGNENWQMIDGVDTSYLLFSRQNRSVKVYHYKMSAGDSVNNVTSEISFKDDAIAWNTLGQELTLQEATTSSLDWKNNNSRDTTPISFKKIEKDKIVFQRGLTKIYLTKTITMADFLVRSRYDYIHGTHYAFDTITFNWRKAKKDAKREMIKMN